VKWAKRITLISFYTMWKLSGQKGAISDLASIIIFTVAFLNITTSKGTIHHAPKSSKDFLII
jgi:hypothetical protein